MRILIAEDDLISRNILQAVLLKFGHEVVAVNDGRQALEALGKPAPPCADVRPIRVSPSRTKSCASQA